MAAPRADPPRMTRCGSRAAPESLNEAHWMYAGRCMVHPVEEALERADTMLENGHPERAIQTLELALFRFPEDARLVVRLAELYAMTDQDGASASYYLQA